MSDNPVNTQDIVSARNIKPLSDYQAQINQRNIFTLTEENGLDKSNKGVDLSVEISNELNLVGLVADKIPQAVIVDQVDHKTYFVKPGESVHGATVLEIHNDNVLLRANGQNITLMRK